MARADVTASFILTSTIAILASEQVSRLFSDFPQPIANSKERTGSASLLPEGTQFLAGHGFVGTLTALVAAGRLDLQDGVRLAVSCGSPDCNPRHLLTSAPLRLAPFLSARHWRLVEPLRDHRVIRTQLPLALVALDVRPL